MSNLADYRHPAPIRSILESLVPVVCPPQAVELGLVDAIVDHVELTMRASPATVRAALLTGMTGYELAAALVPGHLGTTASRLPLPRAEDYFRSWWKSALAPQREFAKGIKGLLCLACYEQPAMMRHIGYTPQEWIDDRKAYRLRTYGVDIARRRESLIAPDPLPGQTTRAREAG